MKNTSVWINSAQEKPVFPTLKENIKTDVLIIGGGLTGILTAYRLHSLGVDYVLCEASEIGSGTTKNTTAVISAQHDFLYSDMVEKIGKEKASLYLQANLNAVQEYKELSKKFECDFEEKPSYIYSTENREKMQNEALILQSLGINSEFLTQTELPFDIAGAVSFPGQAQFHPLKLLFEICKDLNIYENTKIYKVDTKTNTAFTEANTVSAKKIIVATHFPIINTRGLYFMKLYQKRSYVIAVESDTPLSGSYASYDKDGFYFRDFKNMLLIGGGDHRTGKNKGGFKAVRELANKHFKNQKELLAWATQDCMSLDGIPYIGNYSENTPRLFVASGYNEWGMTTSMVASDILSDAVLGKENRFSEVFSPKRSILKPQLFCNIGETLANFVIPTAKRCPHLGCALKWNKEEHTWDCPCHGSRFTEHGKLIDNPATKNAKI